MKESQQGEEEEGRDRERKESSSKRRDDDFASEEARREGRTDLSLELGGVVLVPSSVELSARAHVVVDASSKEELKEGEGRKGKGFS